MHKLELELYMSSLAKPASNWMYSDDISNTHVINESHLALCLSNGCFDNFKLFYFKLQIWPHSELSTTKFSENKRLFVLSIDVEVKPPMSMSQISSLTYSTFGGEAVLRVYILKSIVVPYCTISSLGMIWTIRPFQICATELNVLGKPSFSKESIAHLSQLSNRVEHIHSNAMNLNIQYRLHSYFIRAKLVLMHWTSSIAIAISSSLPFQEILEAIWTLLAWDYNAENESNVFHTYTLQRTANFHRFRS